MMRTEKQKVEEIQSSSVVIPTQLTREQIE